MKQIVLGMVVLSVLVGCASAPPPRYYTLDMRSGPIEAPAPYNLEVLRIHTAEALARNAILIKKSPTQIEYYAVDQWVGPLGDLVAEKLQTAFGPLDDAKPTLYLSGELLAFEQVDVPGGAEAHIKLAIQLDDQARASREPLFAKVYECTLPADQAAPDAVVKALSEGVGTIAGEIAADAAQIALQGQNAEAQ